MRWPHKLSGLVPLYERPYLWHCLKLDLGLIFIMLLGIKFVCGVLFIVCTVIIFVRVMSAVVV